MKTCSDPQCARPAAQDDPDGLCRSCAARADREDRLRDIELIRARELFSLTDDRDDPEPDDWRTLGLEPRGA